MSMNTQPQNHRGETQMPEMHEVRASKVASCRARIATGVYGAPIPEIVVDRVLEDIEALEDAADFRAFRTEPPKYEQE